MHIKQTGRSMIEMLLTLAIIGVLACMIVWGLSRAFTKHKANVLIEDVRLAGFVVVDELFQSLPPDQEEVPLAGHFEKSSSYTFSVFKEEGVLGNASTSFAIVADHVPYNVCKEVKERKVEWLEEILPNGKENICYEDEENSVSFFFNTQFSTEVTKDRACETNDDCGTEKPFCCAGACQISEDCECPDDAGWRKVTNYASDGSETILGQVCCKRGYDTAVAGLCCDASKPYCKEVAYLESTGTQYIDTHINVTSGTKLLIDAQKTNSNEKNTTLAGVRPSDGLNDILHVHFSSINGWVVLRIGSAMSSLDRMQNRFSAVLDLTQQKGYIDNNIVINPTSQDCENVISNLSIGLFCVNHNGASRFCASAKVYDFKLWNDGNLVLSFIPVIDNRGKAGMFDKVSGEMFYNAGSGKFIAGE